MRAVDPHPVVGTIAGNRHAVVPGQNRVDERVIGVEQFEHRTAAPSQVGEEAEGLLVHRLAKLVGKASEALAIDAVVFLEAAKRQPVAGKFRGQAPYARSVTEHAPRLRDQDLLLVQVAGGGMRQELRIGHA